MFRQAKQFKKTFVIILYMRLMLESHAVSDICTKCKCQQKVITCSYLKLTSVPQGIPVNVTSLDLSRNQLSSIPSTAFHHLPSLTRLDLSGNQLSSIPSRAFQHLPSLTHLDLDGNELSSIPSRAFQHLPSLTHLYLHGNKLSSIPSTAFHHLPSLTRLYLHGNKLSSIPSTAFHHLPSLTFLYLYGNQLSSIPSTAFHHLPSLTHLYLDVNKLSSIPSTAFHHLPSLTHLHLYGNQLSSIPSTAFHHLPSLTHLDLDGNQLSSIPSTAFHHLPSLTRLKLHRNHLSSIPSTAFHHLPSLTGLSLSRNKLSSIPSRAFQHLPSLTHLYLNDNQIKNYEDGAFLFLPNINVIYLEGNNDMMCGCHLPAFVKYIKRTYNRNVIVMGKCRTNLSNNEIKRMSIMNYSQCKNYSLFQRKLQCQTCSGMMCNDSKVTSCSSKEPVCKIMLSMKGLTLKFEKSCSTYKKCVEAEKNNTFSCNKWTNSTACVACCTGNLCNKHDFVGWTHSFVFHLIYIKDSYSTGDSQNRTFNEYKKPAEDISRAMERELLTMAGVFKVQYCGLEKNREIFTIDCTVLREITKDQVWKNINKTLNTSQTLRNLGIQQRNMELLGEMVCHENTISTNKSTFYWPMTKIGTNVTIPCHANVTTRRCSSRTAVHLEMPKCSPFTGIWQEPDMSQCYNTEWITRQLKDIKSKEIDKQNIEDMSKILLNCSQKSVYFKEEDIDLAVGIHENMVPLISNMSANITLENILLSINNMINTPEKILAEAEQANRSVSRMMDVIETITDKIPLEGKQVTVLYSNLGIGVAKVEEDTFKGLVYGILYETNETKAKKMLYNGTYRDLQPEDIGTMDYISLPKTLLKHLNGEEQSNISKITFSSMHDDKLYKVIQKSNNEANTKVNSHIIAANIPNIPITNLDEPVTISFNLIHKNATNPKCVGWDESPGQNPHWSTKGCNKLNYVPGEKVICTCNRLGKFSTLMVVYQNEGTVKNVYLLYIISNIGCGISFVCLILTVIIHVCFKDLWKLMASKILVNLCSSLAVANLIFLLGIYDYIAKSIAVCKTLAALLHYFLLTSFMWMTVEALHVCLAMFVVSKIYQKYFMRKSSIVAWGLPAIIVIINLVINNTNNYTKIAQVCWLSETSFYAAFLSVVVIILILNLTIFSVVIWRLISMQNNKTFEHKTRKVRVFGVIGLFFLLGLSWILFFSFGEATEVFKFLFVIFNTLQGMFIFIFYCMYKEDTRDVICLHICKRKRVNHLEATRNKRSLNSANETEVKTSESNL